MTNATVEWIFVAAAGGAAMQSVDRVEAIAGRGLKGDRYGERRGSGTGWDECQVTLIEGEHLERIAAESGVRVLNGEHRRNIVSRGIVLERLHGARFRIGTAVLAYDRPRPPCAYIASITEPLMTRALGARAGICARVLCGGIIRRGDPIVVIGAGEATTAVDAG
ncbi:MAG: MOSC domain-containing protein [Rhodospirillales bacterium]